MEQSINKVYVTGLLVKNGLEIKTGEKGEYIGGDLVVRTADGSEIEVGYYASKLTKDGKESGLYKGLKTVIDEYVSLEQDPENADVVRIGGAEFNVNDYKGKDGAVKTYNNISAKFVNRVKPGEIETTILDSQFEVTGLITKMDEELSKDVPTGNVVIAIDLFGYEGRLIPLKLIVTEELVDGFATAGFYEGGAARFNGKIVNTRETVEEVEQQAFGKPVKKIKNIIVKRFEIEGGSPLGGLEDLKITEEEYETSKSKRRLKLSEIEGGKGVKQQGFTHSTTQSQTQSPFKASPFAKR